MGGNNNLSTLITVSNAAKEISNSKSLEVEHFFFFCNSRWLGALEVMRWGSIFVVASQQDEGCKVSV